MINNKAALPQIFHSLAPELSATSYDCDCACALDLPDVLVQASPGSYDCDCACALSISPTPAPSLEQAAWTQPPQIFPVPLHEGWQAYYNPDGPLGLTVLNQGARRVLAAFDAPIPPQDAVEHLCDLPPAVVRETVQHLNRAGLLRPAAADPSHPGQPSTLTAWLHVTEACNLDCPYCYVHKRPRTMSPETGRRAVHRLVEAALQHGYKTLKLKYAGGEPTLHFEVIRNIHNYALRQTAHAGLVLDEVILSNGVGVSDAILDFAARTGMALMVSMDGDAATHDRVRARRDGQSTHAAVVDTVERAMARGLRPSISITLTALTLDGALEAVWFALERDLPFNLNFYRECIGADSAGPSLLMPDPGDLVAAMQDIFDLIRADPLYRHPLTGILDRTRLDIPHKSACSAGRDYLVFDAEGRIAACQMLLEEPWTDLEDSSPLDTIREHGAGVFKSAAEQPGCSTCPWRTACAGGCPLMRNTDLHARYCSVYQALFPELIRLEANRLIAAHSSR